MNFTQVGEALFITANGAKKRILKYKDDEDLKPFIIKENGKVVGLDQDGLDILRNKQGRRSFAKEKTKIEFSHELEIQKLENEKLKIEIDGLKKNIQFLERWNEEKSIENEKLNAELSEFKKMSFWKRITFKG